MPVCSFAFQSEINAANGSKSSFIQNEAKTTVPLPSY